MKAQTFPAVEKEWLNRFWEKVVKTDSCWLWTGAVKLKGYGVVRIRNVNYAAHRIAFYLHFGRPPADQVLHRCDVTNCVRPDHLFEGSAQDNVADAMRKGRHRPRHAEFEGAAVFFAKPE